MHISLGASSKDAGKRITTILKIEEIVNTPAPEPEPSAEERIASALEYQNLMSMEDVEEV